MASLFRLGDRVKTRRAVHTIPGGAIGTVVLVFISAPDVYLVRFDEEHGTRVVRGADLAPAARPTVSLLAA